MLSEKHHELLTAYVDGELSPRQRRAVVRLLRRSREARRLLRLLESDSRQLRALAVPPMPVDLTQSVLAAIKAKAQPKPAPAIIRRPLHWWTGVAAVASVLMLVGLGSFLYFQSLAPEGDVGGVASNQDNTDQTGNGDNTAPKDREPDNRDNVARDGNQEKPPPGPPIFVGPPEDTAIVERPPAPRPDDPIPEIPETAIGAPSREEGRVGVVDVAIPALLKLRELDQPAASGELKELFARGDGFYLELLARDSGKALDRLQAAFKGSGIGLIRDAQVQARRKQPQLPTTYALYLEDVTAAEVLKVLQGVGAEDIRVEKKNRAEALFNTPNANLVGLRLTDDHRKGLAVVVGTELKPTPPPVKGTGPLGVDIHKDITETTREQVTQAMSKGLPRQGLALVYSPATSRAGSAEIKQFLDQRKSVRPDTIHLVVVIRPLPR